MFANEDTLQIKIKGTFDTTYLQEEAVKLVFRYNEQSSEYLVFTCKFGPRNPKQFQIGENKTKKNFLYKTFNCQ